MLPELVKAVHPVGMPGTLLMASAAPITRSPAETVRVADGAVPDAALLEAAECREPMPENSASVTRHQLEPESVRLIVTEVIGLALMHQATNVVMYWLDPSYSSDWGGLWLTDVAKSQVLPAVSVMLVSRHGELA